MLTEMNRRKLLSAVMAGAAGARLIRGSKAEAQPEKSGACVDMQNVVARRNRVELFFRSYYAAKDNLDADAMAAHWADSGVLLQDHTLNVRCNDTGSRKTIVDIFNVLFAKIGTPGRFSKFIHATGDMEYGVISEFVDLPGTFFARPLMP